MLPAVGRSRTPTAQLGDDDTTAAAPQPGAGPGRCWLRFGGCCGCIMDRHTVSKSQRVSICGCIAGVVADGRRAADPEVRAALRNTHCRSTSTKANKSHV